MKADRRANTPVAVLDDASFAYSGEAPVLRGISLEWRPGERIGVTGPNGSGKTTLLEAIIGLLPRTGGVLRVFGAVPECDSDFLPIRRRIGMLFQDPDDQLFCTTVLEDVAFGPLNLGKTPDEARERAWATLREVGLHSFAERITYRLSFGEKRLVGLAGVLAMEPDALLLDEPTAGLDPEAEARVETLLAGLSQAMLITSHNHAMLHRLSDRMLTLEKGSLRPMEEEAPAVNPAGSA